MFLKVYYIDFDYMNTKNAWLQLSVMHIHNIINRMHYLNNI